MGLNSLSAESTVVAFESDPSNPPEELKDYKREIDGSVEIPFHMREKTHSQTNMKNLKLGK